MKIKKYIKKVLSLLVVIFPNIIKIWVYRQFMGYKIGKDVSIGLSWLASEEMIIEDSVRIGHFNRFKNIPFVSIGHHTVISRFNHFTTTDAFSSPRGRAEKKVNPKLTIGCHVGIAMDHYFDVQDEFYIGDFSTIAGKGSQFFTHQIDIKSSCQSAKPVSIGKYCMLGSCCNVSPGTIIRDYTVIAMGSSIHGDTKESYSMLAGNPAVIRKKIDPESLYFNRTIGELE